jgi:hypothetical protein
MLCLNLRMQQLTVYNINLQFQNDYHKIKSWDSAVSIATGYGLGDGRGEGGGLEFKYW